jgi:Toprim domain
MSLMAFYLEKLKDLPLMAALLAQGGIAVPHSHNIRNPTYSDRNASVQVYTEHLYDFGANESLDLLDVATRWLGLAKNEAIDLIARLGGLESPVRTNVQVKQVKYKPIPERQAIDPNEHALFAQQARDGMLSPITEPSKAIKKYLEHRMVFDAAMFAGVGVVDHRITARLPSSTWGGMLTMPTWDGDTLLACKARNTVLESAKRIMRNLAGAVTPLYNLETALMASDDELVIVEGEFDALSMLESCEFDIPVVGLPGISHWKALERVDLSKRRLLLSLDGDEAGRKTEAQILDWARGHGIPCHVLDFGDGDKNELLRNMGRDGLKKMFFSERKRVLGQSRARAKAMII